MDHDPQFEKAQFKITLSIIILDPRATVLI